MKVKVVNCSTCDNSGKNGRFGKECDCNKNYSAWKPKIIAL